MKKRKEKRVGTFHFPYPQYFEKNRVGKKNYGTTQGLGEIINGN